MGSLNVAKLFDPGVVMYLIILDKLIARNKAIMTARPTEKFQRMVQEQVVNHVVNGEDPPAQIRTAILNIADDVMAGRDVTLRAGDYIALMDFARKGKML